MEKAEIAVLEQLTPPELAFALGNALSLRESAREGNLSNLAEYYAQLAAALYFETRRRGIESHEADSLFIGNRNKRLRSDLN